MSIVELKQQLAVLSVEERFQLAAFLAELEQEKEDEFRAEADRRMQTMDAGRKVTMEQFEEQHRKLQDEGR
jgi:hypothetical protein